MKYSTPNLKVRTSGILLHPTSLPSLNGIGEIGPAALDFLDILAKYNQKWWQMLPISPMGAGNSPYHSHNSFAATPHLISLDWLAEDGLLKETEIEPDEELKKAEQVLFDKAWNFKEMRNCF